MNRHLATILIAAALTQAAGAAAQTGSAERSAATVRLGPGDNIQAAVDANPEGTVFVLGPGVYRQQTFTPKDRQQFIGETGAVLNGAMVLEGWQQSGAYWEIAGLPDPLPFHGACEDRGYLCKYREDLFLDGKLYTRVASLSALGPGKWYAANSRGFIVDDPRGKLAELSQTEAGVLAGGSHGVVLRNLVFEKYAAKAQEGAVMGSGSKDWQVIDVVARYNHGSGLRTGEGMHIKGGSYSYNGQLGIGGGGDRVVIEDAEIAYNNYAHYLWRWEAGGIKFVLSDPYVVRNNHVHHNRGPGIWPDIRNINVVIEGNRVDHNWGMGIQYEISYAGVIRNNVVAENAQSKYDWSRWGSNILIQNSREVEVHNNVVVVSADRGHGINLIQADRRHDERPHLPPLDTINNNVHHNTIIHLGRQGYNGAVADFEVDKVRNGNNVFDHNHYVVLPGRWAWWEWLGAYLRWPKVQKVIERNGRVTVTEDPAAFR